MTANVEKITPRGLGPGARAWLEARGLDSELCERLGLTSRAQNGGEIVIPYERNGVIVNHKYRAVSEKRFHQDPGGEQVLWRCDAIADKGLADQPLIITEGEFDAIAAIQAGFWRTVSVPGGAPAKANEARGARYAWLDAAHSAMEGVKEIIIASDADNPGAALLTDLGALLGHARCKFLVYPQGCKDLNDVLLKAGIEGVKACVNDARWMRVEGVYKLSELPPLAPLSPWRPKVLPAIDKLIAICPGHLSIWTGLAGNGKSALLNACLWSIAEEHGIKIGHAPFESTPQREYFDDAIAYYTGFDPSSDRVTDDDRARVRAWLDDHVVFLSADSYANPAEEKPIDATIDWFLRAARGAVVQHGCRIVVLDPWSQIDHEPDSREREDQYVRRVLKQLKQFARDFDVHVAVVAHPVKPRRHNDGSYEMPGGYEISGAAHFFNACDLGVTVHRDPEMVKDDDGNEYPDENSTRVLIRAWKVKYHRSMNKPGDAYANFEPRSGRYHPASSWE